MMHHGVEGLLLTSIGGYWVLERSAAQKGRVRQIGQLLGGLIIVISLLGVVCRVWYLVADKTGTCPYGKMDKGLFRPYPPKTSQTAPPSE